MNHPSLFALPLAFSAAIALAGTPPATTRPGILDFVTGADSILVERLGKEPIPHCAEGFTDSLRFTHCYPILEQGVAHRPDWRSDLAHILGSRTVVWDHKRCGYDPQAIVRFVSPDHPSELVVFTSRCDSLGVGLLMIRPGAPMERVELAAGGGQLLDLLAEAVPVNGISVTARSGPSEPAEGEFVYYDEEPTPIEKSDPVRSELAKDAQITGKVTLHALVGTDGRVHTVKVIKGVDGLNESAVECVKRWRFRPAKSDGTPVAVWVEIPLDFR